MGSGECVGVRVRESLYDSGEGIVSSFVSYISMPFVIIGGLLVDVGIAREDNKVGGF